MENNETGFEPGNESTSVSTVKKVPRENTLTVSKSNMIIRANYRLTLVEQRILLACIAKINPFEPVPEVITLTADEYAAIYKTTKGKAVYRALKNASLVLPDRVLTIVDEHGEQEV
ncbi:MAG: replication initiation protein, partial [Candidatus Thiodiazotropha sp.]|nr:replication initiation protein [Candidatus Thiodiazotropha sp.]